ncbi:hypothetical protein GE09DRAFT_237539 [Coniochaeta sp. 2T2.1]|nr:hypothetical protein GE09DRAFT_237539 [Coniochaeta sp. 2T2.1]
MFLGETTTITAIFNLYSVAEKKHMAAVKKRSHKGYSNMPAMTTVLQRLHDWSPQQLTDASLLYIYLTTVVSNLLGELVEAKAVVLPGEMHQPSTSFYDAMSRKIHKARNPPKVLTKMLVKPLVHQCLADDMQKELAIKSGKRIVMAIDHTTGNPIDMESDLEIVAPMVRKWLQGRNLLVAEAAAAAAPGG